MGSGYGGTVGASWTRDESVSVDKRGFLWWWEGRMESGLRRQGLEGGTGQGYLLCLPVCTVVVGGYETSLLMSPTVEDGSFVW